MKHILLFGLWAVFSLASCKNVGDKTDTTVAVDSTAMSADTVVAFVPFKVVSVTHTVKDFDAWKKIYDEKESARNEAGLTKLSVSRDMENPNKVYVFNRLADLQKAKDFGADPKLKEAMQKGGVNSAPVFVYFDVVRFDDTPAEFKDRVRIVHKVKDFDAWLKVYDAEGKETRAANGLIDRAVARNIDDPNMIYVTFAISDMAKAKARIADPALKKLMSEAGVMNEPEINYFTSVD